MDFDTEFEFECPKFFDFENAPFPDDERILSPGLNDSWFERDHPLHEPKIPVKREEALKPLININELKPETTKRVLPTKPDNPSKYYKNAKKSLGVKPSVRLKRGEHGPSNLQKPGSKTTLQRNKSLGGAKAKGKLKSVGSENKDYVGDEFSLGQARVFTPPWRQAGPCGSPTKAATCDADTSPKSSQTKALDSPVYGPAPIRGPMPTSTGVRQTSALPSSGGVASLLSPPLNSPKNSMFAKAVGGAAHRGRPRRLLPKTPIQSQGDAVMIPVRGSSQSDEKDFQSPSTSPDESTSNENSVPQTQTTILSPLKLPLRGPRTSVRTEGDGSSVKETSEEMEFMTSNEPRSRPCSSLSVETESGKRRLEHEEPLKCSGTGSREDLSVEDLLKQHNQRVMSSKAKYDENGRRIRTAPTKSDVTSQKSVKASKSSRRSVPSASHVTTAPKRPLTGTDNAAKPTTSKHKQNRRSGVAVPLTVNTIPETGTTKETQNTQQTITRNAYPTTTESSNQRERDPSIKRCISLSEIRETQKQKRRSCAVEPTRPTLSQPGKAAGRTGARQKRRSCVAAPQTAGKPGVKLDKGDQDLMDLIARHNERVASHRT